MPSRTCIACRRVADKATLTRFIESDGVLKADIKGIMPGRGAYVCSKECLAEAMKRKDAFSRALKKKVSLPGVDELWCRPEGNGR